MIVITWSHHYSLCNITDHGQINNSSMMCGKAKLTVIGYSISSCYVRKQLYPTCVCMCVRTWVCMRVCVEYRIVGFFKVLKIHEFCRCWPRIIYMLHMDWKQLHKLHKIIHNRETVLVNMFMGITTIVYSEVLQMFV